MVCPIILYRSLIISYGGCTVCYRAFVRFWKMFQLNRNARSLSWSKTNLRYYFKYRNALFNCYIYTCNFTLTNYRNKRFFFCLKLAQIFIITFFIVLQVGYWVIQRRCVSILVLPCILLESTVFNICHWIVTITFRFCKV